MTPNPAPSPLFSGSATGPYLGLGAPISFWGGVDPASARITDPRHPDHGALLEGKIVWIPSTVGSSSSSSILLELLATGRAPAGLLLGEVDPILMLGVVVAVELGWESIPVLQLDPDAVSELSPGDLVSIEDGMWVGRAKNGSHPG